MPLIGTLLVDQQLITHEQLNAGLRLPTQKHPKLPIGKIAEQRD